jgi:carboxyl-terminal processing protease
MRKLNTISKKVKIFSMMLLISGASTFFYSFKEDYFEISKNLEIFTSLYRELNMFYVDETNPGDLMKTGIDAMLESLDPYTNYIPETDIEDYRFMTTGQYGGIGSLIRAIDGDVYIAEPYENSPSQKAGMKAGDKILKIDGLSIKGKEQDEISKILKGQAGTTVTIVLERDGNTLEKAIKREEIKIPDVAFSGMLDESTGYIRLGSFTRTAGKEVKDAFLKLKNEQGMKNLVFDLRGNGGGLLNEAVDIVNYFIPKGQEVVNTKGKIAEWDKSYKALNEPLDTEIPIVVLVDGNSASASEIVSGSLQDLDRAVVLGENTYGKGLVQNTRPLFYNAQLKLTVAKYYIPSGRCIQRLDYSHRDKEGSVKAVPDSLIKAFKTKNGRPVFDGRGIEPDVKLDQQEFAPILASLVNNNLFFKFASKYEKEHTTIATAKEFRLTDQEYNDFVTFLNGKDYSYTTKTEKDLEKLKETAVTEKYYNDVKDKFDALKNELVAEKENDLTKFKPEIKEILENEIVSRYYYQKGRVETSLANDPGIEKAKTIFVDNSYKTILTAASQIKN